MTEHKTNICCLNTPKCIVEYLQNEHSVYDGCLGKRIDISSSRRAGTCLLPLLDIPENIQEYSVFVIDLKKPELIPYNQEQHQRLYVEADNNFYFRCCPPQNIYDSIPYGAVCLGQYLNHFEGKRPIVIVFQEEKYSAKYNVVNSIDDQHYRDDKDVHCENYHFSRSLPFSKNQQGNRVVLNDKKRISKLLYGGLENDLCYSQTFYVPQRYNSDTDQNEDDDYVIPLLFNENGRLLSFVQIEDNDKSPLFFILPQANDAIKLEIIKRLFEGILYETFSNYFPLIERARWIYKERYALSGVQEINAQIADVEKELQEKKHQLEEKRGKLIEQNDYLWKLITATGEELVQAVIVFLKWLGYENVIDKDSTATNVLEEDIQVDLEERGILVIEVKGIYRTSQDSECSQISKIKQRRERERRAWDVFALYIVNHQRGMEPIQRNNPPFTENQIADAVNDERGLLTTWQLFNIYHAIEMGVISKEQVREDFLKYGSISFCPDLLQPLPTPYKYWQNDTVFGIDISTPISVGDLIFAEKEGCWYKAEIISLQQENVPYQSVAKGRTGVGVSNKLPKGNIYLKHMSK